MGPLTAVAARGLAFRHPTRSRRGPAAPGEPGFAALDLRVEPGQVVGILGPNGAGKSTLLGERAVPPTPSLRRRLGFAPDEPVHIDALTGRENAHAFARAAGVENDRAPNAVARLFEALGLAPHADAPAAEYSYGMRRKLLLVEALAHDPPLILFDEPTLGLDPPSLDALEAVLAARAAAGAAAVLATNDVAAARRLCRRVVLLHHGRAVLEGEPAELVRRAGAGTRIEIRVADGPAPRPRVPGVRILLAEGDRVLARAESGAIVLPELCAAILAQDVAIRDIRIREPDLADVFREATGAELPPPDEPPEPALARAGGAGIAPRGFPGPGTP